MTNRIKNKASEARWIFDFCEFTEHCGSPARMDTCSDFGTQLSRAPKNIQGFLHVAAFAKEDECLTQKHSRLSKMTAVFCLLFQMCRSFVTNRQAT